MTFKTPVDSVRLMTVLCLFIGLMSCTSPPVEKSIQSSGCPSGLTAKLYKTGQGRPDQIREYQGGTARLVCDVTMSAVDGTKRKFKTVAGIIFPDPPTNLSQIASAFDRVLSGELGDMRLQIEANNASGATFINQARLSLVDRGSTLINDRERTFQQVRLSGQVVGTNNVSEILIRFVTQPDGSYLPIAVTAVTPVRMKTYDRIELMGPQE